MMHTGRKLWLVRHGYRQDYVDPNWPKTARYPADTPLSSAGFLQAGDLVAAFSRCRPDHLFVSPYLRTLQTVQPLGEKYSWPIKVEFGLGEKYAGLPLSLSAKARRKFIPQLDLSYRSHLTPTALETTRMAMHRAATLIDRLLNAFEGDLLCITHETPIRGVISHLLAKKMRVRCSFCGITELQWQDSEWQLVRNGDVSHLSHPTSARRFFLDYLRRRLIQPPGSKTEGALR